MDLQEKKEQVPFVFHLVECSAVRCIQQSFNCYKTLSFLSAKFTLNRWQASLPSIDDFPSEWIDNASKVISINNDKNVWDSTNVDSEDAQETEDSGTE